jgi:SAM-dependent methyltransferase
VAAIETPPKNNQAVACKNCGSRNLEPFTIQPNNIFQYCSDCLLYQKQSPPPLEHYEESYHQFYARRRGKKIATAKTRLGALTRYLKVDRPKMLDVGCSIGATVEAGKQLGWQASGVDVSKVAVEFCRDQGLDCVAIDDHRLPYEDNSFDVLTSWHVIEHVTLDEWFRVIKPGGILVLETPDSQCWKAKRLGPAYESFWPHDHLYTFTRSKSIQLSLFGIHYDPLYLPNCSAKKPAS